MIYIFTDSFDVLRMEAKELVYRGLKQNTHKTYNTAQRQYVSFCIEYSRNICPASEDQLLAYIAHLNRRKLRHSTVSVYLSAVRSLHVSEGYPDPLKDSHRLHQALKAIALEQSAQRRKQPITFKILSELQTYTNIENYDSYMMWAAINLGYFGALRASEYCITQLKFDCKMNLCICDVKFEKESNVSPGNMSVFLKCSKNDQYSNGIKLVIGCSGTDVCASCTVKNYLKRRSLLFGDQPHAPLFIFGNGDPLTRTLLNKHIKLIMSLLGTDCTQYSGHSLRAGAATDAARNGLSDWEIKVLGRWSSDAYQRYIRLPVEFKAVLARRMIGK